MKKIIYGLLIAAALLIPTQPQELGKLKAVEVIRISQDGDMVVVETDTGDIGRGSSVDLAIRDMKETSTGTVYLDSAKFVLVSEGKTECLQGLRSYLKDTVRLCQAEGELDLTKVTEFLNTHKPTACLKEHEDGVSMQKLVVERDRLNLK